jgi:hypothetical protein
MVQRVGANLEGLAQVTNLGASHHRPLTDARHVESSCEATLGEKIRDTQVERMAVVPARCHDEVSFGMAHDFAGD